MSLIEVCRAPRTGPVPLPPGRARERAGPQGRGEAETGLWVSPACPLTGEGEQNFVVHVAQERWGARPTAPTHDVEKRPTAPTHDVGKRPTAPTHDVEKRPTAPTQSAVQREQQVRRRGLCDGDLERMGLDAQRSLEEGERSVGIQADGGHSGVDEL